MAAEYQQVSGSANGQQMMIQRGQDIGDTRVEDEHVFRGYDALDELQVDDERGVTRQDGGRVRRCKRRVQQPQIAQLQGADSKILSGVVLHGNTTANYWVNVYIHAPKRCLLIAFARSIPDQQSACEPMT